MHAIGRLFLMAFAYCVAVLVAGVFLLAANVGLKPQSPHEAGWFWSQFIVYGVMTASMIGAATAIPAFIFTVLAETFRWRSFFLHVGVGGLIGIGVSALAHSGGIAEDAIQNNLALMAATGLVGGFVYWLLAGRWAGWSR